MSTIVMVLTGYNSFQCISKRTKKLVQLCIKEIRSDLIVQLPPITTKNLTSLKLY